MKRLALIAALLLFASSAAWGATAFLINSTTGVSVTGQSIWICTYQYGASTFQRVFPVTQMCPQSVQVY